MEAEYMRTVRILERKPGGCSVDEMRRSTGWPENKVRGSIGAARAAGYNIKNEPKHSGNFVLKEGKYRGRGW